MTIKPLANTPDSHLDTDTKADSATSYSSKLGIPPFAGTAPRLSFNLQLRGLLPSVDARKPLFVSRPLLTAGASVRVLIGELLLRERTPAPHWLTRDARKPLFVSRPLLTAGASVRVLLGELVFWERNQPTR